MVTIADVARRAGVSSSTVSYVLSGKRTISEDTRDRVRAAVDELGYRPNASARALASSRVNALALVAPFRADNNVPVLLEFVASIAATAREFDHDVLLITQDEGAEGVLRVRDSSLVDAAIVMDLEMQDPRLPVLRNSGLPCVLIGYPDDPGPLPCVDLDMYRAGAHAVNHLADLGHRTIAMLGSPDAVYRRSSTYAVRFASGFEDAARSRGIRAHWRALEPHHEAAVAGLGSVLDERPETTGLIVHNEAVLPALLVALEARGLRVPEDISVIALCPSDIAAQTRVPLTHIAVPAADIGRIAVETVLRSVEGDSAAEIRLLTPHLTSLSSTAPPRPLATTKDPR
ncbi:LacI family DNA-binding transcriptional regulator [Microbacterium sp.]|uniref:LacI family DNA-binding transcriptional regulator n=1 Tax=Microbacterium sp. TaxID=51671 RepID=UPI0039E4FA52